MKAYRVDAPCPELGRVLMRALDELAPGEEAQIRSRWRYVVNDLRSTARYVGLEVVGVAEEGGELVVTVRRLEGKHEVGLPGQRQEG